MITQAFFAVMTNLQTFLVSLTSGLSVPGWVSTMNTQVLQLLHMLDGGGVWLDWVTVGIVIPAVIAVWASCFVIKLILRVWAFVPEFGGAG